MTDDINERVSPTYIERGWIPVDISQHLYRCGKCRAVAHPGNEPDPCLGELVGVSAACCGHGNIHLAYLMCSHVRQRDSAAYFRGMEELLQLDEVQLHVIETFFAPETLYGRNAVVALSGWPRRRRHG